MRYKTFRNLVATVAVAGVGAGAWALFSRGGHEAPKPSAPPVVAPSPAPAPEPAATQTPTGDRQPLRSIDRRVLERLKSPVPEKVKDAFAADAIKVNLYQDAGKSLPNRVKLDLDRDDKFDEKWTVEGDRISREISSADDDQTYDQRWLLDGETWAREGGAASASAPPPAAPAATSGDALRPMDDEVLALARAGISGDRVKDATAGKPYKVSLYRDAGQTGVNRLKIDLDRDDKWDEKWSIEGETVKRQVAPADDEKYSEEYRLRGGAWVRK